MSDAPRAPMALVRVRRTVPANTETVFRSFTEPAELTKWFGPGEVRCVDARVDLRVGGEYRLEFLSPEGERSVVAGVYREIDPPRRLRFSWIWEVWKVAAPAETVVTIELRSAGRETEVMVTHEGFPDARTCEEHATGWEATIDCLEALLRSQKEEGHEATHRRRMRLRSRSLRDSRGAVDDRRLPLP